MTPDPSALEALARPLVERVARAMGRVGCDGDVVERVWHLWLPEAHAAIAIVVEACAEVADPPLMHRKGKVGLWRQRRAKIASDIRALTDRKP